MGMAFARIEEAVRFLRRLECNINIVPLYLCNINVDHTETVARIGGGRQ